MTTTGSNDGQAVVLSAQDAAFIRQALTAASAVFAQAKTAGGAGFKALQDAALDVPGGRPLAGVHYDVCLAVDLWVPETSSTSCDQVIFVDQASDASLSCYAVLLKVDWFG